MTTAAEAARAAARERPDGAAEPPAIDVDALAGSPVAVGGELEPGRAPLFDPARLTDRLKRWTGILATFFTAQAATQAASLTAGLLFVNFLPLEQFAFYTLASSVLVTLAFATDLGSSAAMLHFFHRSRQEATSFEPWAAAVMSLRRRLFALGAPVAVVVLWIWGTKRGIPRLPLAAAEVLVLAAAWFQIAGTISVLRLRLEDRFGPSYRAEIFGALTRLVLAATLIVAGWRLASPALGTAMAAAMVTAWLARGGAAGARGVAAAAIAAGRKQVVRYLAPTLPSAVYFAIQGQFVIWLAATFGGTTNLAQVGALGRLGLLVGFFSNLGQVVFLPKLVQIADERTFRARFFQFGLFLAALAGALWLAAAMVPHLFLLLLGPNYAGLTNELLIVVGTSGVTLLGGYVVAVNNARSWNRWQVGALTFLVLCQIALALSLPLNTTAGVLWFGLGSAVAGTFAQSLILILGFARPRWVRW